MKQGKKVLFIDYMIQYGHINYNKIHIQSLLDEGYDVKVILHSVMAKQMRLAQRLYAFILPRWLGVDSSFPLLNRLFYILTLLYIRLKVVWSAYDYVILSNTDELSLGVLPLCDNMYLTCHANGNTMTNPLKQKMMIKLAEKNHFIVFNERMKEPFHRLGIRSVHTVSHGCMPPFPQPTAFALPFSPSDYRLIVFQPSPKMDKQWWEQLTTDTEWLSFLENEQILFVLRGKAPRDIKSANLCFIQNYLSREAYQQLFLTADVILLAYPQTFHYQVSGVSFECVSHQKNMLIAKNPALQYCERFYNYNPFFNNMSSLKDALAGFLYTDRHCVVTPADIKPSYRKVFEDISSHSFHCE